MAKHYYEVIIDHDINVHFYASRRYDVGDRCKRTAFDREDNEVPVNGTITAIVSHEEF